jgi:hypothetical protein
MLHNVKDIGSFSKAAGYMVMRDAGACKFQADGVVYNYIGEYQGVSYT